MNNAFASLHGQYTQRINTMLAKCIETLPSSLLKNAMEYSLLAGGKRIRPFLVYATGQMFNCSLDKLDVVAAAIEIVHTYSLIHDDLPAMDNDDLRRGKPTCHIKFDEATAILAGDALQTYAFSLLANAPNLTAECKIQLVNELAFASGAQGMCLGQSLDLQAENKIISLDDLKQIHQHKTGALIKAAIRLAMFVVGESAIEYEQPLNQYADAIGLAFQIQDDVLDVIGDESVMGKHQGADQQLDKNTYTSLLGLEESIQTCHALYKQALEELDKIPYNSHTLHQLANFIVTRNG